MLISLDLDNGQLYEGCTVVKNERGELALSMKMDEAAPIIKANAARLALSINRDQVTYVVLTGKMAVWAYLLVLSVFIFQFDEIYYNNGHHQIRIK